MWIPADSDQVPVAARSAAIPGTVWCTGCATVFSPATNPCGCDPEELDTAAASDAVSYDAVMAGTAPVDDIDAIQTALIALADEARDLRRSCKGATKVGLASARTAAALADVERKLLLARFEIEGARVKIRALLKSEGTAARLLDERTRTAH